MDQQPCETRNRIGIFSRRVRDRDPEIGRIVSTEPAAAVRSSEPFTYIPAAFFTTHKEFRLDRINGVRHIQISLELTNHPRHAFIAFITKSQRPFHDVPLPTVFFHSELSLKR